MSSTSEFTIVISSALKNTEATRVQEVFEQLNLGTIRKVDKVDAQSRGKECAKFFIHYSELNASEHTQRLRTKLLDNEARQKAGEMVVPVKITHSMRRDGSECYWQIYAGKTRAQRDAERSAERASMTSTFSPRIDM